LEERGGGLHRSDRKKEGSYEELELSDSRGFEYNSEECLKRTRERIGSDRDLLGEAFRGTVQLQRTLGKKRWMGGFAGL